ncbi:oligosaccharide flippase family protein [Pseudomonas sp. JH-2]|uniref:oligosaccharide flippase family protein n=1 Tax=Pseudomonas sp. JH-2 TaxID=3114998 RepID=UPI002E272BFF|nr:oligosaccharide flippase family protein [Pseudomonas sp. JH-2]
MNISLALKAISLLWLSSAFGAALGFFTQVILARHMGPTMYGAFSASLTIVTLLAPLAGFGLPAFWLRVFGVEGWKARRWLPSGFKLLTHSAILITALVILWSFFFETRETVQRSLTLLTPFLVCQAIIELVASKYQLEENYKKQALWQTTPHAMRLLLIVAATLIYNELSVELVSSVYSVVSLIYISIGVVQLKKMTADGFKLKGHGPRPTQRTQVTIPSIRDSYSHAWPFGVAILFHLIYYQSNIILLQRLDGDHSAGLYSVAFVVINGIYLLPSVIYQRFLIAKIHRWSYSDRPLFRKVYTQGNWAMAGLGIVAAIALYFLSPVLIPVIFGSSYEPVINILQLLSLAVPLRFVAMSVGATLVTQEHMRTKVRYMGAVSVINVILNFIAIPRYGIIGAAAVTVASELILVSLYFFAAHRHVFKEHQLV